MSQSNVIFGALIIAALIYVTVRGHLPGYIDLFRRKENSSNSNSSGPAVSLGDMANIAKSFM